MPVKVEKDIILPEQSKTLVQVKLKNEVLLEGDLDFNWDFVTYPIESVTVKIPGMQIELKDENYFMFKEAALQVASGSILCFSLNFGCFSGTDKYPLGFCINQDLSIERKRFDLSKFHHQTYKAIVKS